MILRYGAHAHALAEAAIAITRTSLLNDEQRPYAILERWRINGMLAAASQTALTLAIQQLEAAYVIEGQDLTLLLDDGLTETAHKIDSSQTVGGVRIVQPPTFPRGEGAEYAIFRNYVIVLEAELPMDGPGEPELLVWNERIEFNGGGPRDVLVELRNGPPQLQRVSQFTPFQASQSGRAVGYRRQPPFPAPIWPDALDRPASRTTVELPKSTGVGPGQALSEYAINWKYVFHSPAPLIGAPTGRPF